MRPSNMSPFAPTRRSEPTPWRAHDRAAAVTDASHRSDDMRAAAVTRFHDEVRTQAARYAATILGPGRLDALEDVLQEAGARASLRWDTADPHHRTGWFLRIVRNCASDAHRVHHPTGPLTPVIPVT